MNERQNRLAQLLWELHRGADIAQTQARIRSELVQIPYDEVVEVEQSLLAQGLPVSELIAFCDIHTQVLDGVVDAPSSQLTSAQHPLQLFRQENQVLLQMLRVWESMTHEKVPQPEQAQNLWIGLAEVDRHYRRKENLLFPFLEKAGIDGPSRVMWGKHDEIRTHLKTALEAVARRDWGDPIFARAVAALQDMVQKEEQIFFPLCEKTLTAEDWKLVGAESSEIGYAWITPTVSASPQHPGPEESPQIQDNMVRLPTGNLTLEQLTGILDRLPVDISFVDADNRVRYFNKAEGRIFDRSVTVLGRDVRLCHPPHSVHIVDQILNDFRSGRADSAPFWINLRGRFIHIEYFAIRNEKGEYLGCLEVSQDLTEKRRLEGEQRLLTYSGGKNDHT